MSGKTFTDYKDIILMRMIQNTDLLKALTITNEDFLTPPLTITPHTAIYKYIFPYAVHPDIITDTISIITMKFTGFKYDGIKYQSGRVYFYTICHESLIKTDYGNRYDYIYEQLRDMFNENRELGIGKAIISETSDLPINKDYMGNVCTLEISDFK
ncbi:MAG: hypothetical protein WC188_12910 [Candidatus Caldatribacteriota bacterium]